VTGEEAGELSSREQGEVICIFPNHQSPITNHQSIMFLLHLVTRYSPILAKQGKVVKEMLIISLDF
jgi:hypothetical protein